MAKDEESVGFAIGVDDNLIEDNLADSNSNEKELLVDKGLINHDGVITKKGWDVLRKDVLRLENNSVKWLKKHFNAVRDEGHDSHNDLIGSVFYDPNNTKQVDLVELGMDERIDMLDASYGDLANSVWDGVSDFGGMVLGGAINFYKSE